MESIRERAEIHDLYVSAPTGGEGGGYLSSRGDVVSIDWSSSSSSSSSSDEESYPFKPKGARLRYFKSPPPSPEDQDVAVAEPDAGPPEATHPDFFKCHACRKVPPPLSATLSSTTLPFHLCSRNHLTCRACYNKQETTACKGCGKIKSHVVALDPYGQPGWLKRGYKAAVENTVFECGRQCGTPLEKGGLALALHEEQCTFDPPCVCPVCDKYTFKWPTTQEEKDAILAEHGHHLRFHDPTRMKVYLTDLYDPATGNFLTSERAHVFKPDYPFYTESDDGTVVKRVDHLSTAYPYLGCWLEWDGKRAERGQLQKEGQLPQQWSSDSYKLRAKWLQRHSRLVPDDSYILKASLYNFHDLFHPDNFGFRCKITQQLCEPTQSAMHGHIVKDIYNMIHLPCNICKDPRKHLHLRCYIDSRCGHKLCYPSCCR